MVARRKEYAIKLTADEARVIRAQLEIRSRAFHQSVKDALNETDALSRMKEGDPLIEAWRANEQLCARVAAAFR